MSKGLRDDLYNIERGGENDVRERIRQIEEKIEYLLARSTPQVEALDFRAIDDGGALRMIMSAISTLEEFGVHAYLLARDVDGNATAWIDADSGDIAGGGGAVTFGKLGIRFGSNGLLSADGAWGIMDNIRVSASTFSKRLAVTDGGFSSMSSGADGKVYQVVKVTTDTFIAVGEFTYFGGVACYGAAITTDNGATWSRVGWGFNGPVYCVAVVSPTEIYFGGDFTKTKFGTGGGSGGGGGIYGGGGSGGTSGAIALNRIAKYDGTDLSALGSTVGANGAVRALAVSGSTIAVGGDFTTLFGTSAARVCTFDKSTLAVTALGAGVNNTCYGLAWSGSNLYAVGAFTGTPAYVGKYNGSSWSTPGSSPPTGTLYAVAISGSDVYVGGNVTSYLLKSSSGGAWAAVGTGGPSGIVRTIAIDGSKILVGGDFSAHASYYASATWKNMGSGVNGTVYSVMAADTDDWIVAGDYTAADGDAMNRIARYSPSAAPADISLLTLMQMLDVHSHYVPLYFRVNQSVSAGASGYGGLGGSTFHASDALAASPMRAGVVNGLDVDMSTNMGAGTGSCTATLYKNGSPTGITLSIPAGTSAGVISSGTTVEVTFAQGDTCSVKFDNGASVGTGNIRGCNLNFRPD